MIRDEETSEEGCRNVEVINCLPNIVLDNERVEEEMNKNKKLPACRMPPHG